MKYLLKHITKLLKNLNYIKFFLIISLILINNYALANTHFYLYKDSDHTQIMGRIKITNAEEGITFVVTINDSAPKWSNSLKEIEINDHIELWLTNAQEIKFPPIGWGDQFKFHILNNEEDCKIEAENVEQCKIWFEEQKSYRNELRKLFSRHWLIAPNMSKEKYATKVFQQFDHAEKENLCLLNPINQHNIKFSSETLNEEEFQFQFTIPWEMLPPLQSLNVKELKFRLDLFKKSVQENRLAIYSSDILRSYLNKPNGLNILTIAPLQNYYLSACKYDIDNITKFDYCSNSGLYPNFSEHAMAFYLPNAGHEINNVLILDNEVKGYQYNPDMDIKSPILYSIPLWSKKLDSGITLCGPILATLQNNIITYSNNILCDIENLESKNWNNNYIFIKNGPYVFHQYYRAGQNGGCPKINLEILSLEKNTGKMELLFKDVNVINYDGDINISPDWQNIDIYSINLNSSNAEPFWNLTRYKYNGGINKYELYQFIDKTLPPTIRKFNFN